MAWNGAGNFQRTNGSFSGSDVWQDDANAGYDIVDARHDTHDQDLAQGINNCLTKDGQNSPTTNLSMNTYKHLNVGDGTARNQYATVGQLQDQGVQALSGVGGTANAITASMNPVISAYVTGARYTFKAISNSSSTVTLKIDSAPVVAVQYNGAALVSGEIASGRYHEVVYDGTNFQLLNPASSASTRTLPASVAQVQDGDYIWLGTTGGAATAQTASATPAITAYKAGQKFRAKIGAGLSSTGQIPTAHTININGLGAKTIANGDEVSSPTIGTWVAGNIIELIYDGTYMRVNSDAGGWLDWTPSLSAPVGTLSAITVNLAKFRKIGHLVTVKGYIVFTGTGVGQQIEITNPPVALATSSTAYVIMTNFVVYAAAYSYGYMYNNSATNIAFTKDVAATNFGTGSGSVRFVYTYQGQ
jgi:hypothetical protein